MLNRSHVAPQGAPPSTPPGDMTEETASVVQVWRKSTIHQASNIAVGVGRSPLLQHLQRSPRNVAFHAISLSHTAVRHILSAPLMVMSLTGVLPPKRMTRTPTATAS